MADNYDGEFLPRICVYDKDGKFVWTFGRGAAAPPAPDTWHDGQIAGPTKSIAVSADGRVYVSGGYAERSVLEFVMF